MRAARWIDCTLLQFVRVHCTTIILGAKQEKKKVFFFKFTQRKTGKQTKWKSTISQYPEIATVNIYEYSLVDFFFFNTYSHKKDPGSYSEIISFIVQRYRHWFSKKDYLEYQNYQLFISSLSHSHPDLNHHKQMELPLKMAGTVSWLLNNLRCTGISLKLTISTREKNQMTISVISINITWFENQQPCPVSLRS